MSELDLLAERFETDRAHLRAVAQRMLGSADEADDAVQETWVRLSRSDTSEVGNLTGWLTTVVSRVCLDMLRSRAARREDPTDLPTTAYDGGPGPEQQALLSDAIGPALLLVLDTLGPSERLAFVLHDMFAVPFPEIAEIVGCTPAAARQLASRARRRVQGERVPDDDGTDRRRAVVSAFLIAARAGDFSALLTLLDPGVVLRADPEAVKIGATAVLTGAGEVAGRFNGGAQSARLAFLDGEPGLVWAVGGQVRVAFVFGFEGDRVSRIDQLADPSAIEAMTIDIRPNSEL
ncbi:sigma-70 family RNA polymerase sigma factor [Paractinoplanes atraurantiacus]|uniref:RNA polymerase sigma-70 factor, ECF subfamily n=1 Tax=Paractinoplanes atraurantiacus TaxID=1036182 RepID=A0A285ISM6_9ACTN|nr:sigma-70 family RNA polymerase sigma factor [Actinoplanes atraurantiacus]SNY51019.1 RNA polymerase sigma-70 factor, ECF subfamily [Actinoplanes atraurantiacus]